MSVVICYKLYITKTNTFKKVAWDKRIGLYYDIIKLFYLISYTFELDIIHFLLHKNITFFL